MKFLDERTFRLLWLSSSLAQFLMAIISLYEQHVSTHIFPKTILLHSFDTWPGPYYHSLFPVGK